MRMQRLAGWLGMMALVFGAGWTRAEEPLSGSAGREQVQAGEEPDKPLWRDPNRWSFQIGAGLITDSTIDDIALGRTDLADGDAEGQIYLLQASYKLAQLAPVLWGHRVEFDLELPLVLGLVDENARDPFLQYNGGVTVRWKRFPWNKWLYTNFETGVGLTYSQRVLATERVQHPTRDRSHLEFYWPVQLMLAHPRHREHQLTLFIHHHSGGTLFHRGGANTVGLAYRYVFGEREKARGVH